MSSGDILHTQHPEAYSLLPVTPEEVMSQNLNFIDQLRPGNHIWLNFVPAHGPEPTTDLEVCDAPNRAMLDALLKKCGVDILASEVIKVSNTADVSSETLKLGHQKITVHETPSGTAIFEYETARGPMKTFGALAYAPELE